MCLDVEIFIFNEFGIAKLKKKLFGDVFVLSLNLLTILRESNSCAALESRCKEFLDF